MIGVVYYLGHTAPQGWYKLVTLLCHYNHPYCKETKVKENESEHILRIWIICLDRNTGFSLFFVIEWFLILLPGIAKVHEFPARWLPRMQPGLTPHGDWEVIGYSINDRREWRLSSKNRGRVDWKDLVLANGSAKQHNWSQFWKIKHFHIWASLSLSCL